MAATCSGRAKRRNRGAANCRSCAGSPNLAILKAEYFKSIKMQRKRCNRAVTEVHTGKSTWTAASTFKDNELAVARLLLRRLGHVPETTLDFSRPTGVALAIGSPDVCPAQPDGCKEADDDPR